METKKLRWLFILIAGSSLICLVGCKEGSSRDKAIELPLNTIVKGVLKAGTVVYYKFAVEEKKMYEFKLRESIPLRMTLLDEEGNVIDFAGDESAKAYWGSVTFDPSGTYFLRLDAPKDTIPDYPSYDDKETASYELMLAEVVPVSGISSPEIFADLILGTPIENKTMDFFDSKHYYKISIPATANNDVIRYVVSATQPAYSLPISLALYDYKGTLVYTSYPTSLSLSVSSAETNMVYYVVVQMSNSNADEYARTRYNLYLELAPRIKVEPATSNVTADAGVITATIGNAGSGSIGNWWASVDYPAYYWMNITGASSGTESGTLTIQYSWNTICSPRTGTVSVYSSNGGSAKIYVQQEGVCP